MFAVIYIPNFSLQSVLRYERELVARPVALADASQSKSVITQVNSEAREYKVLAGMTPSQAMARCAKLAIRNRSHAQEDSATDVLHQTAYAYSPNIEATAPGVCTLELKGLGIYVETAAQAWAEKLRNALALFHLDARIGIAPTPSIALLAAQAANPVLVAFNPAGFIPSLPVESLEPPPELLHILSGWGIRTIGAFLALGRERVVERLGPAALDMFRRVSLDNIRPLKLVSPPEHFSEQMEFEHEIETAEPLLFVLRRFVEQLARRLDIIRLAATGLHLELKLSNGTVYERFFKIPSPTSDIEILFRMLQTHLETVRTDSPIVMLQLTARAGQPDTHQFGLFETTLRNPNQFAETLARLTALCGPDRVGTPALKATHRPDAFQVNAPVFSPPRVSTPPKDSTGPQLRRFRPPLPVQIELRYLQPTAIHSPIFSGAVTHVRGPFISSGDWWDSDRWAREEWDVETADGSLLRIFRSIAGTFVEGAYD